MCREIQFSIKEYEEMIKEKETKNKKGAKLILI